MKLLFVHDHLGAWSGAEANLFEVARALRRRGHEAALLHGAPTGRDEAAWQAIFPRRIPSGGADTVRTALRETRADVVFLHNSPGVDTTGALAEAGIPVARMVHDHQLFCLRGCRYPAWSREACTRAFSAHCFFPCGGFIRRDARGGWTISPGAFFDKRRELDLHRRFARMIVASEYMREELLRNGFARDRIEIHPPIPPAPGESVPGVLRPVSRPRLVFAGQVVRGKGVDVLLEALALVRRPFECVIVGDGSHRPYCEELCHRLGLDRSVRFVGYVRAAEVAAYYRSATAAVFSSVWPEPFGLSGLEALRHGVPVVAFDVGGVREWLEDGVSGLLAPNLDRAAFAERVERLLADPTLARRLGEQGRALAAERFDFDRYIDGIEALLLQLAEARECEVAR